MSVKLNVGSDKNENKFGFDKAGSEPETQPETDDESGKRRRKKKRKSSPEFDHPDRKPRTRVSLGYSAIALGVILTSVIIFFISGGVSRFSEDEASFSPALVVGPVDVIPESVRESLDTEDAVELVRSAIQNRDPALVESFFILGASATTPQQAIELLEHRGEVDGLPVGFESLGEKMTLVGTAEEVVVLSEKNGQISNRLAQLFYRDGKWRIDLDSYARHIIPGWETILGRKTEVGVIRVFVKPDTYYTGDRYVEDLWKCYAITSLDVDEVILGYAARGSAQEEAMDKILSKEEKFHRATIEIITTSEQGRRKFEICRVLSDDWFMGEANLDESF